MQHQMGGGGLQPRYSSLFLCRIYCRNFKRASEVQIFPAWTKQGNAAGEMQEFITM